MSHFAAGFDPPKKNVIQVSQLLYSQVITIWPLSQIGLKASCCSWGAWFSQDLNPALPHETLLPEEPRPPSYTDLLALYAMFVLCFYHYLPFWHCIFTHTYLYYYIIHHSDHEDSIWSRVGALRCNRGTLILIWFAANGLQKCIWGNETVGFVVCSVQCK